MKGILDKPDMIKAIIEGRKTQTRRLIKELEKPDEWECAIDVVRNIPPVKVGDWIFQHSDGHCIVVKPRYRVGEVVYIKEAFRFLNTGGGTNDFGVEYKDGEISWWVDHEGRMTYPIDEKWHSPRSLKGMFARYFIKILEVKAQRLAEITPEEVIAEGVLFPNPHGWLKEVSDLKFQLAWDRINPKYLFESNPWDFAYRFKLEQGGGV